jgi:hypothetical protein
VRAYYSAVNAALATGLVGDLEHLSVEGCACRRLVGYIREKWTAGSIRGAKFTVTSVAVLGVFPAVADVLVEVSVPAYDVLDRSGRVVERVPPDRVKETVKLAPNTDGRWLVVNIFGSSQ